MKKKWEYKYPERLVEAMVSEDYVLSGEELYFVHMTNGRYPRAGIYCVNADTGEAKAVFETTDFLRVIGATDGNCFYFTSLRGVAYCVTKEGGLVWKKQLGEKAGAADFNVVLEGDRLYMAQDALYCLDPKTGETIWANDERGHGSNCTILVEGDYIYHAKSGKHLYCVEKATGKTVWTYGDEEWCRSVVSVDAKILCFLNTHGKYLFLDKQDGHLIREVKAGGKLMRRPLMIDGTLFVGENLQPSGGRMVRYKVGKDYSLETLYEVPSLSAVTSEAVIVGDRLYFGTEDGSVYCVNKDTGEAIEKKKKVKGACRSIVPYGGGIIALSDKGPAAAFA